MGEAPSDPRRDAAEQLAADGDYEGARAAYEAILHANPGDAEAAAAVKQMADAEQVHHAVHGPLGGVLAWLANTALSALVGVVLGAIVVTVVHLVKKARGGGHEAPAH